MLALRRAKKAADEAAMAEAMLRRPPGDDTPVVEPDALRPVELRYGVAWLLEAPDEEEERCARRQRRRSSWAFERHGAFGARRADPLNPDAVDGGAEEDTCSCSTVRGTWCGWFGALSITLTHRAASGAPP